jgi:hypothetical protein
MRDYKLLTRFFLITATLSLYSCASPGSKVFSPISDDNAALRLGEVMFLASREEILALGVHYKYLLDSGIKDSELRNGSLVEARVYCCGGKIEQTSAPWVYVPPGLDVKVGDIIEIKMGRSPDDHEAGIVNTAVRVRQSGLSNGTCKWIPENPALWMRVIYCDWMKEEGWIERGGLYNTWLKRLDN